MNLFRHLRSLLFGLLLIFLVVWIYKFELRTWVFLVVSIYFLVPAFLFRSKSLPKNRPIGSIIDPLPSKGHWALAIWIFAFVMYWAIGYFAERGFTPNMHDEYAYIFQAETFANGKLYYPPPVHPEFFDAFHILTEKIYASKYPPGHALILVPGLLLGVPMLMPLLLSMGSLMVLYFWVKEIKDQDFALISTGLLAISPLQIQMATSYLSHSTTLFFLLLFAYSLRNSFERRSLGYPVIAGIAIGIAFITRPLTAFAVASPFIFYFFFLAIRKAREGKKHGLKIISLMSLACFPFLIIFFGYNTILMGSPLKFPWTEYTQRYMPADNFGFGLTENSRLEQLSPRKADFYQDYVQRLKRDYTFGGAIWQLLVERLPDTLRASDDSIGLVLFLPLAFSLPMAIYEKLMLWSVIFLFLAHFFYYGGLPRYQFEAIPFIIYFIVRGTYALLKLLKKTDGNLIRSFLVWHLLSGAIYVFSFKMLGEFNLKRDFTRYHSAFRDLVNNAGPEPKVIFVRYQPKHNYHFDLINNEPNLQASRNIFVLDLGGENQKLMRCFRGRSFFLFDEKAWKLEKLVLGRSPAGCSAND
ncbi:MAG: hypothetical protein DMG06_08295 [Acidobacteria bacterium]|nr:MAG: hypothetical protein DMG06_08295 [Acidobacteriota bacterium]